MELLNPMKGIGFGWSLMGYARLRVGRTSLSRFAPAYRAVRNQDSTVLSLKSFKWVLQGLPHAFKKNIHDFAWLNMKLFAQPGVSCRSFLALSRLGQAGFWVMAFMVSEHCCDLVASQMVNIIYYMNCVSD